VDEMDLMDEIDEIDLMDLKDDVDTKQFRDMFKVERLKKGL
jgi:hypothetical protein